MLNYFRQLAHYNQWANNKLYAVCAQLPSAQYYQSRKAFFDSIHGTLNHILVVDKLWQGRIKGVETKLTLDRVLFNTLEELHTARVAEDKIIIKLLNNTNSEALTKIIQYRTTEGEPRTLSLQLILQHLFNHQTHHRGQVHTMLSQADIEPPALDLVYFYGVS